LNAAAVLELAWHGAVIPAIAALVTFLAVGWLAPGDAGRRYQAVASFAVGVFVGFVLLPSTNSLIPSQYWEWIPWFGLLAALVAGLTKASGVLSTERWLAYYLLASAAALLIVPTWPELSPARPLQIAVLSAAITALAALLIPLPKLLPGVVFPFWLMVAAVATSALVLSEQSETFGRPAALPAGSLAGCIAAAFIGRKPVDWSGLALPYAVIAGGYAYLGAIYPMTPLWPLLVVPLAPVALWICALASWAHTSRARAAVIQAICVLTPIIIVAAVLISRSAGGDDW
jgi:hypothetical protein